MGRKAIRRSQVIAPFGVGALVDFPGQTWMLAGLDVWPDQPECKIEDSRLAHRLGVQYFRAPPPAPKPGQKAGAKLPCVRFPLWHMCPRCRSLKRANWNDPAPPRCDSALAPTFAGPTCKSLNEKKRRRMIPLRFLVACEAGHVDDFPWEMWAHTGFGKPLDPTKVCSHPQLRLSRTGKAGLMGLVVKCEGCDAKSRSLMGSAGPNSLKGLKCSGARPWLGPHGGQSCTSPNPPRMLQRGATNLHFPKIASSILIPPYSDPIWKLLEHAKTWSILTSGVKDGEPDETRLTMFSEQKNLDLPRLRDIVRRKLRGEGASQESVTEEQFRYSEYQALLEGKTSAEEEFCTRHPAMGEYADFVRHYFDRIVLVEKLAETRVLNGFSRIMPPPYREFDRDDQLQLCLKRKPWLPGIRVYGEGIFLRLNESTTKKWLKANAQITKRYAEIVEKLNKVYKQLGRSPRVLPSRFFLLHTLAHVLIRRLSFECGYGSSSLRERLYCWEDEAQPMSGMLIYTAAGDSEGTMGGLVRQGKKGRFEDLLRAAIADSLWCSSDPLCVESRGQGIDSLNRAACHACALLPETSCEEGNRFLDRVALVGKADDRSTGYFAPLVEQILSGTT